MDLEYHFASEEERELFPRKPIYEDGWKYEFFMTLAWNGVISIDPINGLIQNNNTGKIYNRVNNTGYIDIPIKYNGTIIHAQAHRVIWWSVNGPIDNKLYINHINGIKTDNRLVNLEVVTNQENIQHAWSIGLNTSEKLSESLKKVYENEVNKCARFNKEQIYQMFDMYYNAKMNMREIGDYFDAANQTISEIIRGKTYKPWTKELLEKYPPTNIRK